VGYSDVPPPGPGAGGERGAVRLFRDDRVPARPIPQEAAPPPPQPQVEPATGEVEIWSFVRAVMRRKFLVLAVVVLGISVATLLTLQVTPLYAATTTLEIQARESQIIQGANVEPLAVADAEFIGTQVNLLTSKALAERVAEQAGLMDNPAYADPEAAPDVRLSQAANVIRNGLSAAPVRGARIIQITYETALQDEAADIANAVAENFIELNLDRRYNATAYARKFLEERLSVTKASLEDTERRLVEYSRDQQIVDLTSVGGSDIGSSLDASSLVSVNSALTAAQNDRIIAEQRYREAASSPSTSAMLESQAMQSLRQSRSVLMTDFETKLASLRPEHPEMVELQSRINAVERQIEGERQNMVKALEAGYRAAVAQEEALAARVVELKNSVQGLRIRSINYNILQREADTLRTQYDALLQRMKDVSIGNSVGSSQVSVLDLAERPDSPFEPNLSSALLRAAALSFALAVGLALLIELLDDRIKTPEDVSTKLGTRLLGVVPKVRGTKGSVSKLLSNPRSDLAEAYSSARTALQLPIISGSMKTLVVTGSKPSEGKTTTTLALASSFAAIGKKVLIIDADLRRPSFSYDPRASLGLSGVLADGSPLKANVVPGPSQNLYLLPSGNVPPNPAELLAGTRLLQLINEAREEYDFVFVDSPPVLSFADAPILSSICDGTIFVVQAGAVFRQAAVRALDRLHNANARIVGTVLVRFDARKAGYGASYAYGYGYGGYRDRGFPRLLSPNSDDRQIRHFSASSRSNGPADPFE
jgi:polysaccharide biosynthesis transport protein